MRQSSSVTLPARLVRQFLTTHVGIWFGRYVLPCLDTPLLYLSRGRYSMSPGQPILLLFTVGARTGKRRATPLLYQRDGERVIMTASNGGRARHPAWYYNLRANPIATVFLEGHARAFVAREAKGEERATLWRKAVEYFAGFAVYEQRTKRVIPIMVLTPCVADGRQ